MIPERVALALIARGWILRNKVVWAKPNGMPSSVTDRLATKWEYVFHLVRQPRYFYDLDAVREEPIVYHTSGTPSRVRPWGGDGELRYGSKTEQRYHANGVNPGDVWWCDEEPLRFPAGVLTSDEVAYMAAFIDGEGSISIRRRERQIQFVLTVVNTHEGIIRWLRDRTGMGQIKQREVRNEKWRQVWEWSVTSRQAAQVIHAVYPHLRVKRQQAAVALHFMETTRPAGGGAAPQDYHDRRHAMAEDVAALNAGRITESQFALDPVKPQTSSAGDVWTVATQPYPDAHFAVFPPELIRRPILATVPGQVCRRCGKGRERVVEVEANAAPQREGKGSPHAFGATSALRRTGGDDWYENAPRRTHVGWSDCGCYAGWTAGTVLDPFFGSGTTGVMARRLGRRCVGVELNPDYCRLAAERFREQVLDLGGAA